MNITNPMTYFKDVDYRESLIISIEALSARNALILTTTFADVPAILTGNPAKPEPGDKQYYDRDFRQIAFSGVENLKRSGTILKHGYMGFNSSDLSLHADFPMAFVIDAITVLMNCVHH